MSVVYALATPPAKSAICVFRVSGEGCLDALEGLFQKSPKEHGFFCVRDMYLDNEIIDSVGLISFKGPKAIPGKIRLRFMAMGVLGLWV